MTAALAWLQLAASFTLVAGVLGELLATTILADLAAAAWGITALMLLAEAARHTCVRPWVAWIQIVVFVAVLVILQCASAPPLERLCLQCVQVAAGISAAEGIMRVFTDI
jgi:hypothetical protein